MQTYSAVATALVRLKKNKSDTNIVMINAKDFFEKKPRTLDIPDGNIQHLVDIYHNGEKIEGVSNADSNRRAIAYTKALALKLTQAQTRELIDDQLSKCGWEADTNEIRYSRGTRPTKGKSLAIAEWPTDSKFGNNGYADYAKMIKPEHQKYVINRFGAYMAPFLYATNGRPYIKQYEQMSGIWFLDVRESFNSPKVLSGWPTPVGIEQALEKDLVEVLQDPDGIIRLRQYKQRRRLQPTINQRIFQLWQQELVRQEQCLV